MESPNKNDAKGMRSFQLEELLKCEERALAKRLTCTNIEIVM